MVPLGGLCFALMVASSSGSETSLVQDPDQDIHEPTAAAAPSQLEGIFVLGPPESGCRSVGTWLASSGYFPVETDEGFFIEVLDEEPSVIATAWAEFLMSMAGGSWDLPPLSDQLIGVRSSMIPAFNLRLHDAIDCAHGAPVVVDDERLLPILPIIGSSTLSRFLGILVLRNPLAIARTLSRKYDIALSEGICLWEHYMAAAFTTASEMSIVVAPFDDPESADVLSAQKIERLIAPDFAAERLLAYDTATPHNPRDALNATDAEFRGIATEHQVEMWTFLTETAKTGRPLEKVPESFTRPSDTATETLHDGARLRSGRVSKQTYLRAINEERAAFESLTKRTDELGELLAEAHRSLDESEIERTQLQSTVTDLIQRIRTMGLTQAEGHRKADRLTKELAEVHERLLELIHDSNELEKVYKSEIWRVGYSITLPFRRIKESLFHKEPGIARVNEQGAVDAASVPSIDGDVRPRNDCCVLFAPVPPDCRERRLVG